jgi:hypothetical protein
MLDASFCRNVVRVSLGRECAGATSANVDLMWFESFYVSIRKSIACTFLIS